MYIPCDKAFPRVPKFLTSWPWLWSLTYFEKTLTLVIASLPEEVGLSYFHMCIPCSNTFNALPWFSDLVTLTSPGCSFLKKIVLDYDFWIRGVTHCCYLHMVAAGELCCLLWQLWLCESLKSDRYFKLQALQYFWAAEEFCRWLEALCRGIYKWQLCWVRLPSSLYWNYLEKKSKLRAIYLCLEALHPFVHIISHWQMKPRSHHEKWNNWSHHDKWNHDPISP